MRGRAEEGRHDPTADPLWVESWHVDFCRSDGLGGFVHLATGPGSATFYAWLVGVGAGPVVVRAEDVPLPTGATQEIRATGLWAELTCEKPYEHWGIGLEAFAVRLDHVRDALAGERGERVALGFDLEWEAAGDPFGYPGGGADAAHYQQPGSVHGEILLGDERLAFDGHGERDHSWGPRDWWSVPWHWAAWQTADGGAASVLRYGDDAAAFVTGYVRPPGGESEQGVSGLVVDIRVDSSGFPAGARYEVNGETDVDVEVMALTAAPVVADDGRRARWFRALCRFTSGGEVGTGWAEWLEPPGR